MLFAYFYQNDGEFRDDDYESFESAKRVYWEKDRSNYGIGIYDRTNHILYVDSKKMKKMHEAQLSAMIRKMYKVQIDEIKPFVNDFTGEASMEKANKYNEKDFR